MTSSFPVTDNAYQPFFGGGETDAFLGERFFVKSDEAATEKPALQ